MEKQKKLCCVVLAALILASCSSHPVEESISLDKNETEMQNQIGNAESKTDGESLSETNSAETEPDYIFPSLSFDGEDFTFLNNITDWGFTDDVVIKEMTGDALKDVIFENTMRIEDTFDLSLNVLEENINAAPDVFLKSVLAGEDLYKFGIFHSVMIAKEKAFDSVQELTQFEALNLDQPWWDQSVTEAQRYLSEDKQYFGGNSINLIDFEDTMCLYMNEDMIEEHGLDPIYDIVREGTWTFDKLRTYTSVAANLNGDNNFRYKEKGNAVYGITTWNVAIFAMLTAAENNTIARNDDGDIVFVANNEHFHNSVEMIADLFMAPGECIDINGVGLSHYEGAFAAERSMFTCAQLKASTKYRDIEFTYGIVPIPKYDESQERYYSHRTTNTQLIGIPVTNAAAENTAVVIDAMAYLAYARTLPTYWDINMTHKQLRNQDSIEMLELIYSTRTFDIGMAFGWTTILMDSLKTQVLSGNVAVASTIKSCEKMIEKKISKTMETLNEGD